MRVIIGSTVLLKKKQGEFKVISKTKDTIEVTCTRWILDYKKGKRSSKTEFISRDQLREPEHIGFTVPYDFVERQWLRDLHHD